MEERQDLVHERQLKEVFVEAAGEARQRIRRDAEAFRGDESVTALLDSLDSHLFAPELDVGFLLSSSGVPRRVRDRFAAKHGPLKTYFNTLRVEVAARLLSETGALIKDIAKAVGFDVLKTFSRTFKAILGKTPHQWRQLPPPEPEAPPDDDDDGDIEPAEPPACPLRVRASHRQTQVRPEEILERRTPAAEIPQQPPGHRPGGERPRRSRRRQLRRQQGVLRLAGPGLGPPVWRELARSSPAIPSWRCWRRGSSAARPASPSATGVSGRLKS